MKIRIETTVAAKLEQVWDAWVSPEDVVRWNFALAEWCCPKAENDLRVGGWFNYRMESCDGSQGFDFRGKYLQIDKHKLIEYELEDGRQVQVEFFVNGETVTLRETFEVEDESAAEKQRQGWTAILHRFSRYVEEMTSR